MIPFTHLGWAFKTFGPLLYPSTIRSSLCDFLQPFSETASVLDIGAGTGVLCELAHACKPDLHYHAIDPFEGMLKYAKPYVKRYIGVAEALPFEDHCFDGILMGEALHHFKDVDSALAEIVRVLKEDGKVFIYDFDRDTFRGKSICKFEKLLGEPGNFFTPQSLEEKLEGFGFKLVIRRYAWRYVLCATLVKHS